MSEPMKLGAMIEALRSRGYFVNQNPNRYDRKDMVQQISILHGGPVKVAAYKVRDPETDEWSKVQFHMLYGDTVLAVISEEAAKLLCKVVEQTLGK